MADMHIPSSDTHLTLQPMVHVEQIAASVSFYERLGGRVLQGSRDGDWVLIELGGGQISLLAHPPNPDQHEGTVELNFQSRAPLGDLESRLRAEGITITQSATDESFGRQLQIKTPDGLLIKINELEANPEQ